MEINKYTKEENLRDKGVYMIKHRDTNTVYIGSTSQKFGFEGRWRQHLLSIKKGIGNKVLCNVYNKYGIEGFEFSILERMNNSSESEIRKRELFYINKYDSYKNGANCSLDTSNSFRLCKHFPNTPEKCKLYRLSCTTKKPMYVYNATGNLLYTFESSVEADRFFGLKRGSCSDKARYGWSLLNKYWFSREQKQWNPAQIKEEHKKAGAKRASETRRKNGSYFNKSIRKGFHVSEESKRKQRLSSKVSIKIDLFYLDGTLYKTFDSLNECDDFLGLTRGTTSKVMKRKNWAKTLRKKYIPKKHTNTVLTNQIA